MRRLAAAIAAVLGIALAPALAGVVLVASTAKAAPLHLTPMLGQRAPGVLHLVNLAGPRWPVVQAENAWNATLKANGIPLRFANVRSCAHVRPCGYVVENRGGLAHETKGGLGGTAAYTTTDGWWMEALGPVTLFDGNGDVDRTSWRIRYGIVMHELGHELGLDHDKTPDDLMFSGVGDTSRITPSLPNLLALRRTYVLAQHHP